MFTIDIHQTEEFKLQSRNLMRIVFLELILTFALTCVVYYSFLQPLWYTEYLNVVLRDWKKGPITELQMIPGD